MARFPFLLPALALLCLSLSGCGGGSSKGSAAGSLSRSRMIALLKQGFKTSSSIGEAPVARDAKSAGQAQPLPSRRKGRNHDEGNGDFFYSDWLGLWVETVFGSADDETGPTGERYWVDHDKTQVGGHTLHWVSASGVYPMRLKDEHTLTAGAFAGEYDLTEITINEDETGSSQGRGVVPNEVSWKFTGSWDALGHRTFSERAEFPDGTWQTYAVKDGEEDGTETTTIVTSQGATYVLRNAEDFSGSGTIEGPFDGLPATMAWDSNGDGFVTWRDGTKTAFNLYE